MLRVAEASDVPAARRWSACILTMVLVAAATVPLLGCAPEPCEPVEFAPSPERWITLGGKPTVLVGDSVTQGWQELGTNFDHQGYLDALASRGINAVLIWSFIGVLDQREDPRIGYDAPELWPWIKVGDRFDLDRFNDAYFERLRHFIEYAHDRRIVVVITVHDGWTKTRFSGHPFNMENGGSLLDRSEYVELARYDAEMPGPPGPGWTRLQRHQYFLERFCDRLIDAAEGSPNVIFEIFNEGAWYGHEKLARFQEHFVAFFRSRTGQPIMVNNDHVKQDFHAHPDVDIMSLHSPVWNRRFQARTSFSHFVKHGRKSPPKPYFFTEPVPAFDGRGRQLTPIMRLMWGAVMGGGSVVVQNDASFGFDPNTAMARLEPSRNRMLDLEGHLARFFNESGVRFARMAPRPRLSPDCVVLADPGIEYVIYSQSGGRVLIDLADARSPLQARFYNPRTGRFGPHFVVEVTPGRALTKIGKPDRTDWVLHLASGGRWPPSTPGS